MIKLIEQTISWNEIGKHERSAYAYRLGKAVISKDHTTLTVHMTLNFIIPYSDYIKLKEQIKNQAEDFQEACFHFTYTDVVLTEEEIARLYLPYMIEEIGGKYASITRTILTNELILQGQRLTLFALGDLITERLNNKVSAKFEQLIHKNFGFSTQVCFQNHEDEYKKVQVQKKALDQLELTQIRKTEGTVQAKPQKQAASKPIGRSQLIKPVKGTPVKLGDLSPESGNVIVEGILFKKEQRTIKNGKKLVTLLVTDKLTSVCIKGFLANEKWEELDQYIREGDFVRIQGEAEWDTYENVTVVTLRAIEKDTLPVRSDTCEQKRVELHAHTKMSAMDGLNEIQEMIKLAAAWKHKAIAITDHGVVQAFPDAAKVVKKNKLDIKIIYGVEGYFFDDTDCIKEDGQIDYKTKPTNHIVILAQTQTGLKNLYKLISLSHLCYFYKRPRIPKSVLSAHREGLLIGSACEAGQVYRCVLEQKDEETVKKIVEYYDYLEIQPLINNQFMIDNGQVSDKEELIEINRRIIELGEKYGKPVAATCDAHYSNQEDSLYRKILMAGQGYKDIEGDKGLYLRTTDEMLKEFSYLGEEKARQAVIDAPNQIADLIEVISPVPAGRFPPKIENAEEILRKKCMEKAWSIYGNPLPEEIHDRLERELSSIINNGYAVMYVSAEMLVQKSLDDGYLVGSRGSVGSSFAATMAGITEVNPLPPHYICPKCKYFEWGDRAKYDCGVDMAEKECEVCGTKLNQDGFMIPFETFLGFEGDKEPDIDLNFAGEYQSNAHKYVEEIFGKNNVFRAGTIGTIAEKTAYGFVKKYYDERGIPINKWEADRLSICCTGVRRTTGQHPGGIIIVPKGHEIYEFCPVQHPANDMNTEIITTHFDYHSLDENLLKLDILGHDVPSMIRHLQDMTGVDPITLPLKDAKVNSIFNGIEGLDVQDPDYQFTHGSYGIPEFGTRFVRQMLDDTKPEKFSALVKISGFSHGTNVWLNNAQEYIKNGIASMDDAISTRDDIMRYLILKGLPNKNAFKIMESVRKGKGVNEEEAELMRQNDVPEWYIESCRKIEYMFPRAHAVAYVMMAYRIAYYKVYNPLEFYAVYFTTKVSDFDSETILKGSRAILEKKSVIELKGKTATKKEEDEVTVLEVAYEMYARGYHFAPARIGLSEASRFIARDGKVILPLEALTGLGENAAKAIAFEYSQKPFDSVEELRSRTKANKTAVEALKIHGALDGLPESDQLCLF